MTGMLHSSLAKRQMPRRSHGCSSCGLTIVRLRVRGTRNTQLPALITDATSWPLTQMPTASFMTLVSPGRCSCAANAPDQAGLVTDTEQACCMLWPFEFPGSFL